MSLRSNVLVAAILLAFGASASPLLAADVTHDYLIDRSAVPATVFHRKLTLLIDLGNCTACQATADGVSTTAVWLAASKQCRVDVPGSATGLSVKGLNWTGGGTGAAQKSTLYQGKKWAYSFTWDDSRDSVLPNAKPVFDAYGYRAGMAINPGIMGGWGYMTWDDLDQLYAAGWGVFNHSWDHDSPNGIGITNANVDAEIDPARSAIEARYPGYPDSYFVYPFNYINDFDAIRGKGFLGAEAETGENYVDNWPLETSPQASWSGNGATDADSFWLLRRHQAYRDTPVSTWNGWLDNAAADARPRWCIAFSHQCIASPGFYDITPAMLNTHLKYLHDTYGVGGADNVWMAPSEEVLHYLYARRYTTITRLGAPLTPSSTPTWSPPSPTRTVTPTPSLTPTLTPFPCGTSVLRRVNAGGSAYTDGAARLWEADQAYAAGSWGYIGGTADSAANAIAGTTDDVLYQTERWGSPVEYRFTVPNGRYQVRLLFAEVYWTAAGARVFNISLEGATAVSNLDLWALVGKDRATELSRTVTVTDGVLNVLAVASADAAKFSALEIAYINDCASPSPSPTATPSASRTPQTSATASSTPAASASASATPALASPTPTRTPAPLSPTASPTSGAAVGTATATATATSTRTPAAGSATLTASASPSPAASASATVSATPQASAQPTQGNSPTLTPTLAAPTPTATPTPAVPTLSATPSQSPLPTGTSSPVPPATGTPTATAVPTGAPTLTATRTPSGAASPSSTHSPTATPTITCACLPGPSATASPTAVASPPPAGETDAKVLQVQGAPNPNPRALAFKLDKAAERVELRVYGPSMVCVGRLDQPGPWGAGWNRLALSADLFAGAPNGLYHLDLRAGEAKASRAVCRVVLAR